MPPKGKLTDEQKQANFDEWKSGSEWKAIERMIEKREKIVQYYHPMSFDMGVKDITLDFQPYLDELFKLVQDLRVPGKKAKEYSQMYVRTMFFEKTDPEKPVKIDGNDYYISGAAQNDMWGCKEALTEFYNFLDAGAMEMNLTFETYTSWKKDLIKLLKEWDKLYVKHIKGAYPEMSGLHAKAMLPLTNLVQSNLEFHYLEDMMKNKKEYPEVPNFRYEALEEQFSKYMTGVLEIFKEHGDLNDYFDIRQMLKTLKIENWKQIAPYNHYLTPLETNLKVVRTSLIKMHKDGHLRIKYIIEDNAELQKEVIKMVKSDGIAQWLMGDSLKQDQFRFYYNTMKIIYDSALKEKLVATDKGVLENVLPKLIAFKSLMVIRNIQLRKADELKKAQEKAEATGKPWPPVEEEVKEEEPAEPQVVTQPKGKKGKEEPVVLEKSPEQIQKEKEEKERLIYGRFWIWEGYFSEKSQEKWLETAEALKHINDQVLQDIEDSILLEGFKGLKTSKIHDIIENDHKDRIKQTKKLMPKDGDEYEKQAEKDIKKRHFMNDIRPPNYWNFVEDGPENKKVKHVLRANARPTESYEDGRVQLIQQAIEEIGMSLQRHEESKWETLKNRTLDIFKHENAEHMKALEEAN